MTVINLRLEPLRRILAAGLHYPLIYYDRGILVLNKPSGIISQLQGGMSGIGTLLRTISSEFSLGGEIFPVHRLDRLADLLLTAQARHCQPADRFPPQSPRSSLAEQVSHAHILSLRTSDPVQRLHLHPTQSGCDHCAARPARRRDIPLSFRRRLRHHVQHLSALFAQCVAVLSTLAPR